MSRRRCTTGCLIGVRQNQRNNFGLAAKCHRNRAPRTAPSIAIEGYFAMSTMWSTAAFTISSDRSARPPLAGITPALPWKPLRAWS